MSVTDATITFRLPAPHFCLVFSLVFTFLTGCTPQDGSGRFYEASVENPLALKATWFRYVGGTDIRQACGPATGDRYRLVYNGHYNEQLRSYEVLPDAAGGAAVRARALVGSGIGGTVSLDFDDPLASWRWTTADDRMAPADLDRFVQSLAENGAFAAPPVGARLHSNAFYWVATGCRGGAFFHNVWIYPSARFAALTFPALLLGFDGTGVAVNPPRPRDVDESLRSSSARRTPARYQASYFVLEVGENGLRGL